MLIKAKMEVEIISRELIKPSSPTPLHLKTHKLCLFDQFRYHWFSPLFLFYPLDVLVDAAANVDDIISTRIQLLKQSLSQTLVQFYPFAGRLKKDFSVDCNDEGVYFAEAKARSTTLGQFLNEPDLKLMNKFFPMVGDKGDEGTIVAKIQVTSFSCGGIVVAATNSHLVGDGVTTGSFMKYWAAANRAILNCDNTDKSALPITACCPNFDASSLFPQREGFPKKEQSWTAQSLRFCEATNERKIVLKRFVFDTNAMADIKALASSSSIPNPTRVEAISAFISKRIMAALEKTKSDSGIHLLSHTVNLRPRANPPLPDTLAGNIICSAKAPVCTKDEHCDIARKLRKAIKSFDEDLVNSMQGAGGFLNVVSAIEGDQARQGFSGDVNDVFYFSSWLQFGYYEIDFGWGKPIWICVATTGEGSGTVFSIFVLLMNTRRGNGIEAWVRLSEECMALFQADEQLLAFATMDPSPINDSP